MIQLSDLIVGDHAIKEGGDYRFIGTVVCVFNKLNGVKRIVVENGDGILHIFAPKQLRRLIKED